MLSILISEDLTLYCNYSNASRISLRILQMSRENVAFF
jgi:hypothetical protein